MKPRTRSSSIKLLSALLIGLCAGCVTANRTNKLEVGMTRDQVVAVMGEPENTAAQDGRVMILRYQLRTRHQAKWTGATDEYYVRLVDGKAQSWGIVGDFNSTKDPTMDLNIKVK